MICVRVFFGQGRWRVRLGDRERGIIRAAATEVFGPEARVLLFRSRVEEDGMAMAYGDFLARGELKRGSLGAAA